MPACGRRNNPNALEDKNEQRHQQDRDRQQEGEKHVHKYEHRIHPLHHERRPKQTFTVLSRKTRVRSRSRKKPMQQLRPRLPNEWESDGESWAGGDNEDETAP
jgi:hypothetical protein